MSEIGLVPLMVISSLIYLPTNDMAEKSPLVYIYHIIFIYSSLVGPLGRFPNSGVVSNAAVHIDLQVSL